MWHTGRCPRLGYHPGVRAGAVWDSRCRQPQQAVCHAARLRDVIICLIFFGADEPLPEFIN